MPPLRGRVQDGAGLLTAEQASRLAARLERFERETGHQIAVLTVPSLEGEAIEAFSMRVAEAWQLGDAQRDDGVIVVVAAEDRRARLEVGYGLEGVLPDAIAARILRERMIPEFRRGAMGAGIERGVDAILAATRGEALPEAASPDRGADAGALHAMLLATIVGMTFGSALGRRRWWLAGGVGGGIAGGLALLLTFSLAVAGLAAFFGGLFGLLMATGRLAGGPGVYTGRHGSWGGGGFGGGGFGGGGFGGGGGGFGGGGASGSW